MHNKAWPPIMQDRLALALGPNTRLSKQMLAVARALTTSWEMLLWMTQSEAPSREEKRREEKRREEEKNREQKNNKKKHSLSHLYGLRIAHLSHKALKRRQYLFLKSENSLRSSYARRAQYFQHIPCQGHEATAKADSTLRTSQAVPHPSTNRALCRLSSEVGRDPVHSTRYGRQRMLVSYLLRC